MPRDFPILASILPEHGLIAKLELSTNGVFNARKSQPDHLECGAAVDALADSIQLKLTREDKASTAIVIEKLSLGVLRNDDGPADGMHWALFTQVGGHYVIVDLTHLQYDLPRGVDHASPSDIQRADRGRHALALASHRPAVFRGTSKQAVIEEWRSFVLRKTYVTAVRHVTPYPETLRASAGAMARAVRS